MLADFFVVFLSAEKNEVATAILKMAGLLSCAMHCSNLNEIAPNVRRRKKQVFQRWI
jgi:hypothetical protein